MSGITALINSNCVLILFELRRVPTSEGQKTLNAIQSVAKQTREVSDQTFSQLEAMKLINLACLSIQSGGGGRQNG